MNTFGATPAALYLARRLASLESPALTRACTVRVNSYNQNTNGILQAVDSGLMSAKVGANLLRLLRQEAASIQLESSFDDDVFVSQLLRNVIIGRIKQAIRKLTVVRKVENGGTDLNKARVKASRHEMGNSDDAIFRVLGHVAGVQFRGEYNQAKPSPFDVKDDITPETLMEKSNRRCARQGKPHMDIA